jgi:membrane protein DedA with SNARE-associated domain
VGGVGHAVFASLEHFTREYGAVAVFLILALESLGAPVPGETLLIFAAVLARRGDISLPALMGFAWAGSMLGDNIGYAIGRYLGRRTVARYGAKIGVSAKRFRKVEEVFARFGSATVTFARFFAVLRQLNGVVAGTLGMPWQRFLLFNALGAALWVAVWVLGAYYLGAYVPQITAMARQIGVAGAVLAAVVLAGMVLIWLRHWRGSEDE